MLKQIFSELSGVNWITEFSTDTQYYIKEDDDSITILFQWSISWLDWIYNFLTFKIPFYLFKVFRYISVPKKPYKKMPSLFFVHAGFLKKYKAIRKPIIEAIQTSQITEKKIKIIGYSQGAALGMLLHEDIAFTFGVQTETYLFGTPRVFSWFGSKILKERLRGVKRIENGNDLVTHVPPWLMGFKHYGKTVHVGEKRKWWKYSVKDHANYRSVLT